MRHSGNPTGPSVTFSPDEWRAFSSSLVSAA